MVRYRAEKSWVAGGMGRENKNKKKAGKRLWQR
jgi:hypothetical protein